ncbi:hypothetical protein CSKR_104834 [Clonorchis sinensis]|uniref:Uncharacterized protein n=1 Tax=Clonorchis sinensis TaxID=79923 RepID=A0A3R7CFN2_CLOSI|nr:hypothetical protein CSKR_104834 [Clonorchis sinensis]
MARWLKWLERESTDRKVRGSNPAPASRLPLSRLGQPGSIPALVLPSGSMAVRHRKGATTERMIARKHGQKRSKQWRKEIARSCLVAAQLHPSTSETAQWLEREFTDRKIRGSNPTSASQLPLSRLGRPGGIPSLMLPSGGMAPIHGLMHKMETFAQAYWVVIIIDSMASVFNTDASLPYNHDLFGSLIVKKRIKWGSCDPHPGRQVALTASKHFPASSRGGHLCFRHSELGIENSTLLGKRWFVIRNTFQLTQLLLLDTSFNGKWTVMTVTILCTEAFGELCVYSHTSGSLKIQGTY